MSCLTQEYSWNFWALHALNFLDKWYCVRTEERRPYHPAGEKNIYNFWRHVCQTTEKYVLCNSKCATLNQDVSLKGEFIWLLQPWNNSPNPDFQDQFDFDPMIQTFNTPAKALKHSLFKKNPFA